MPRRRLQGEEFSEVLAAMLRHDGEVTASGLYSYLQAARTAESVDHSSLDRHLVSELARLVSRVHEIDERHEAMQEQIARVTSTPWVTARFLGVADTALGMRALVVSGGARQALDVGPALALEDLDSGDEVFLSSEKNLVMAKAGAPGSACGETAVFERIVGDGRVVVAHRDETLLVTCAAGVDPAALKPGQKVLWDRNSNMVLEATGHEESERFVRVSVDDVDAKMLGGQRDALERLLNALASRLLDPELSARYGVSGRRGVLLSGPPGVGKTLLCRIAAAEIQRRSARPCSFVILRPAELESVYVSESERNVRAVFDRLRELAETTTVVVMLDEVDSIARTRGNHNAHHSDKTLTAWMAALDGHTGRGDIAIVATCNAKHLIDPAMLERISEVDIHVPRPGREAAREIFAVHLPGNLYYAGEAAGTRQAMIDAAVAMLYESESAARLCTLHFRDGTNRQVYARDLASGRLIEQICVSAREKALVRHLAGCGEGMEVRDVQQAAEDARSRLASQVTVRNARDLIADLPEDVDVVRIDRPPSGVKRRFRYLRAA